MNLVDCPECEGFGYFEAGDIIEGEELEEDTDCETCEGDGVVDEEDI